MFRFTQKTIIGEPYPELN